MDDAHASAKQSHRVSWVPFGLHQQHPGLLIENLIAAHLHALSQQSQARLYYWRDKQQEVDLVYDHPEKPLAFEIGLGSSHHRRGIQAFMARFRRFQGGCFYVAPDVPLSRPADNPDQLGTLPLDLFLLAVSAQAEYELERRLKLVARPGNV